MVYCSTCKSDPNETESTVYVNPNFKSKAALKRAIAAGEEVTIFQPGPFAGSEPSNGHGIAVEGPHYPQAHTWYGQVDVTDGLVTKVK